ncbi:type IV fimbrial biogenesis protein FimT [Desulfuromusa kysingii]|uniref:Type II secretion system protein H n=1 Tax=Desulfuromusa kysingii TaxID=37625 RepID=A0A1H4EA91_9BACT|nr:GspH/FimT family pseudopilin [Desulfuromusa kysingii]SEA81510.1 type IV fimbrial biogenesis protein FimT [Desulfuromusa kysingii]
MSNRNLHVNLSSNPSKTAGFTLLELITALVLAGILMTIAIPSLQSLRQNSRAVSAVNNLISHLNYARNEAVSRATQVTICKSGDGINCDLSSTGWQQGWKVYYEAEDGTIERLRVVDRIAGDVTIEGNFHVRNSISYGADGFLPGVGNGTIIVDSGDREIDIIIAVTGRIRTVKR